jgi:hypothetical protein
MADPNDIRQREIREGAGLEESRLNQEFIDLLKKYLTPALVVVALAALGYVGWQRYQMFQAVQKDNAWVELDDALRSRSPTSLAAVADTHAGIAGVPELARLTLGDVHLESAIRGVKPGGELDENGVPRNPDEILTAEQRAAELRSAAAAYEAVLAMIGTDRHRALQAMSARFGLAAVHETTGDFAAAETQFRAIESIAEDVGMPALRDAARERLLSMEKARSGAKLLSDAQLATKPTAPWPPTPPAPPQGVAPMPAPAPSVQVPFAPEPAPAQPAPTPAPAEPAPAPAPEKAPGTGG